MRKAPDRLLASALTLLTALVLLVGREAVVWSQAALFTKIGPADGQQHTIPAVTGDTFVLLNATQTLTNKTFTAPAFTYVGINCTQESNAVLKICGQYYAPMVDDGNSGTAKTIDWNTGNEHYLTLTGNVTLTLSNPTNGGRYVILFATGAGGFTVNWPGAVVWSGGVAPTITATASKVDLCTLMYLTSATKYYGACNQGY